MPAKLSINILKNLFPYSPSSDDIIKVAEYCPYMDPTHVGSAQALSAISTPVWRRQGFF